MGVDIDGSEAPPEPTINWLRFPNIFWFLSPTGRSLFVVVLVIFVCVSGVFSKVRESPEKAPLWSRWGSYTSTASTQSECYSAQLPNSNINTHKYTLMLIYTPPSQLITLGTECSLWMGFPQALQRLLGPVSHAKLLISPPSLSVSVISPPFACSYHIYEGFSVIHAAKEVTVSCFMWEGERLWSTPAYWWFVLLQGLAWHWS